MGKILLVWKVLKWVFAIIPMMARGVKFIVKAVRFGKKVRGR